MPCFPDPAQPGDTIWMGAVDAAGYAWFFTGTAALGLPVLLLVWLASRFHSSGD
jgi:hypothetical protein